MTAFVQLSASPLHAFHLSLPLFILVFGCRPSHVLKLCSLAVTVLLSEGVGGGRGAILHHHRRNGWHAVLTGLLKAMGLAK